MPRDTDKALTDLHRLLASQKFSNEDELRQFLNTLTGGSLDELPKENLTPSQRAEDMVYEARNMPPDFAGGMLEEALSVDPECIAAFEGLGHLDECVPIANAFFEKGISLGRERFGGAYLNKNKGHFWGLHETRPFMRCMSESARCLYEMGKKEAAITLYRELLELNPNDNQGVRDLVMLYLIETGDYEGYQGYAAQYDEHNDILAFPHFNKALATFKQSGASDDANAHLRKAHATNKFVSKRLLARKPVTKMPGLYSPGSAEEADIFAYYAWKIWQDTPGAVEWVGSVAGKAGTGKKK
jgi:tetratricopeptide (TPR) repeat protein